MSERGLPWYVFGAQAAIIWGSPRLSADVDVTALIAPGTLTAFMDGMSRHGFELAVTDSDFVTRTRVLPFVHRASSMPLDIVLAGPGLEEDFLSRAVPVDIGGTPVPVISPDDLIVTKILAGRPKDIEDIRGVIGERRASLHVRRIRGLLRILEQALGQSDLLPVFEREWGTQSQVGATPERNPRRSKRKTKKK